jgi:hypothetical protein
LPADGSWRNVPRERCFLYALFLAIDANFRMKRRDVSSEEEDPSLGDGVAFFAHVEEYMQHLEKHWNLEQEVRRSRVAVNLILISLPEKHLRRA